MALYILCEHSLWILQFLSSVSINIFPNDPLINYIEIYYPDILLFSFTSISFCLIYFEATCMPGKSYTFFLMICIII